MNRHLPGILPVLLLMICWCAPITSAQSPAPPLPAGSTTVEERPPDQKALAEAMRITDPRKKLAALDAFLYTYPKSSSVKTAQQEALSVLIKNQPDQKVRICFIEFSNARFELISPMTGNLSLTRFLDERGEGLHHICLGVADIAAELARLAQQGARLIDEQPRIGAGGHKIAFVHPESTGGVLIELEETIVDTVFHVKLRMAGLKDFW
jgi:methylmalonyl-CoA/ethylmalonyl-CoA epimerase